MLDIDVADRCRSPVESLAATYTVGLDSGALARGRAGSDRAGKSTAEVAAGSSSRRLPRAQLVMAEAGRTATRVQVFAAIQPGGFTHRLHYRWRWASSSGLTR